MLLSCDEFRKLTRAEKIAYAEGSSGGPYSTNKEGKKEDAWIHDEMLDSISPEADREQRVRAYNEALQRGDSEEIAKEMYLEESDYPFIDSVTARYKAQDNDPNYDPWKD